ncbi:hypothetical protein [Streptomyces sp. YIM 121038]
MLDKKCHRVLVAVDQPASIGALPLAVTRPATQAVVKPPIFRD